MTAFATACGAELNASIASDAIPVVGPVDLTVDIRSVNGRFLDLSLRLPDELRALEPVLRESVTKMVKRGKIELRVTPTGGSELQHQAPNAESLSRLAHLESTIKGWLPNASALSVFEVIQLSKSASRQVMEADTAVKVAERALSSLLSAREREGARLATMLYERLAQLRVLAAQAKPLLPVAVQRQRERFLERWTEALRLAPGASSISDEAAHERALAEAASHAIRIDVAEELTRLSSHIDEIERLLRKGGEVGKRLEFLIQELHREANTLGSKSTTQELTAVSVDMKVAIEQMREQVQNIE